MNGGVGLRLGIDLGGTKIEIAALDGQGRFLLRERVATPQGDYAATLRAIAQLVAQAEQRLGVAGLPLGMGIPGSLSPLTGRVRNANSTVLNGQPLRQDLERVLNRPLRLENDANCLALSEATDGAGAGAEVVFAAILGTGVGAGIAVRGQVLHGRNGIAGEWGHNPLPPLAGAWTVWKPGCPARRWRRTMRRPAHRRWMRRRSWPPCVPATRRRAPAWSDTRNGWRARWLRSLTCSIPTSSCWVVA